MPKITVAGGPSSALGQDPEAVPEPGDAAVPELPEEAAAVPKAARPAPKLSGDG